MLSFPHVPELLRLPGYLLALGSIAYLIVALRAVAGFPRAPRSDAGAAPFLPPVTVLVPAHGLHPGLYGCLRSICDQRYPEFQVVFGLHTPDDPARAIIERLIAEFPTRDISLVINGRMIGANPKNCNLANIYPKARHDIIVMVDSDVRVGPTFLAGVVAPLTDPGVGGVTCVYKAAAEPNFASALGALAINDWFIPSALVDLDMREIDICYGAAIAVTRKALEAVGGFEAMASAVAQDFVLGQRLTQQGYRIALANDVVETVMAEPNLGSLFRHELRWNRAVRACRPRDHLLSLVMQSLPLATLLLLLPGPAPWAFAPLAVMVGLRIALHYLVRARIPIAGPARPWLVPVRECASFGVWAASFLTRRVRWGARTLVVGHDYNNMLLAKDDRT
jgi:ceramide glucosyltransferase